jgi:cytochrome d ubiquinol oxidase subunit II
MVSSTNTVYNLTVSNTASPGYSLRVMTVVAVVFFPIVLCYQIWGYYTFRKRLSVPRVDGSESTGAMTPTETEAPVETEEPVET